MTNTERKRHAEFDAAAEYPSRETAMAGAGIFVWLVLVVLMCWAGNEAVEWFIYLASVN